MTDVLRLLQRTPTMARLAAAVHQAGRGDPAALEYLKREGWREGLELLQPGLGQAADELLKHGAAAQQAVADALSGRVIEGEFREVDPAAPWSGFVARLVRQTSGGHIILGPMGQGKTTLALRLAQRWREEHGYRVECVNVYGEDVPPFAVSISVGTLISRMARVRAYLDALAVRDEDDEQERAPGPEPDLPPTGRVVVIDEASLGLGNHAADRGRRAALQALAQCRHLDWHVVYIGQWAGQLPLPLFGLSTVYVKRPSGREALTDRDNPVVRDLWERAGAAFADVRRSTGWDAYPDVRAWAYVDCQSLGGGPGYTGLVPFSRPDRGAV